MPKSRSLAELALQNRSAQMMAAGAPTTLPQPGFAGSQAGATAPEAGGDGGASLGGAAATAAASGAIKSAMGGGSAAGGAMKALEASEGIGALLALFCWVAAEYYPRDSSDWLRCRNWVLDHETLCRLYIRHGEQLAGLIRRNRLVRALVWPLVEWARWHGRLWK